MSAGSFNFIQIQPSSLKDSTFFHLRKLQTTLILLRGVEDGVKYALMQREVTEQFTSLKNGALINVTASSVSLLVHAGFPLSCAYEPLTGS